MGYAREALLYHHGLEPIIPEKFKNAPSEAFETEEFISLYNESPPLFIGMEDFAKSIQSLDGAHGFDDSCGTC